MSSQSRTEQAYAEIKHRLISCELEPGRHYTESHLMGLLGWGKTPVREALARLAHEGWVSGVKGRGYEVLPLSVKDLRDAYGARLMIEPEAAAFAAGRLDPSTGKRLRQLCAEEEKLGPQASAAHRVALNREVHMTIVGACANELLANILQGLIERCERLAYLAMILKSRHSQLTQHHVAIVDAVIEGDADRARATTREHLLSGQREALEALLSAPAMRAAQFGLRDQLADA